MQQSTDAWRHRTEDRLRFRASVTSQHWLDQGLAMVTIGIVGIGFMGMIHYLAFPKVKGAKVIAICSRDPKKRAGDWRSIRGNFGPRGQRMDLSGVTAYEHLEDLLNDPKIDLVDVCNPTYLHAATAVAALKAGKHVLVEKPMALTLHDADVMLRAAGRAGKLLLVGHVLPFFPEFAFAAHAIREGPYGSLLGGHFKRIISRPDWSAEIADPVKTGGPAIDLHIHDSHFIGLVAGIPEKVFATGVVEKGAVQYLTTQYLYPKGGPSLSCSSGALAQAGRSFTHGFEIYLEKATLLFESGVTPLTVLTADGHVHRPRLKGPADPVAGFAREIQAAATSVRSGQEHPILSGQLARDALNLVHKEIESVHAARVVAVS